MDALSLKIAFVLGPLALYPDLGYHGEEAADKCADDRSNTGDPSARAGVRDVNERCSGDKHDATVGPAADGP